VKNGLKAETYLLCA